MQRSGASLIWISHDLGAVRRWCDRIVVMHQGRIVEEGPAAQVINQPRMERTRSFLGQVGKEAGLEL